MTNPFLLQNMELLAKKLLDETFKDNPFVEGYESYNPPVYRIEYYMTQREYSKALSYIGVMWTPSDNASHFMFARNKMISSLVGHSIRFKINP
jgi:hypothetical protein